MTAAAKEVVDFIAVLDELRRHGHSLSVIAAEIGVDRSSVHDYHNGAVPQFHVGERLVVYWCNVTSKPREQVPMTRAFPSASRVKNW